jgi:hypothetical protein
MARDSDRKGSGRKKDKLTVTMVTPPFRMAFPALFTPEETDNGERYKVTALFPPDANLKKLKSALNECMVDAFGEPDDWPTGRNDVHPDDKLYDAGTKEYNGFKKGWTALSIASTDAPGIVDADGEEVLNKREVYGGRWARAHVAVTSYDNKSKGVTVISTTFNYWSTIPRSPVRETRNLRLTNMNSKTDPKTTTTNPKTVGAAMTEAVVTGTMVGIAMGAAMGAVGAAVTAGMIGAKRPEAETTTTETPPEDVTETVTETVTRIEPIANALDVAAGHGMGMATETELQDEMNRHVSDLCKALRIDPATIAGIPETTTDRPAGLIKRITTGIKRFF